MKVTTLVTILLFVGAISFTQGEITPRFPGTQPIVVYGNNSATHNTTVTTQDNLIIDTFTVNSNTLIITLPTLGAPPTVTNSNFQSSTTILGGQRSIILSVTSGQAGKTYQADVTAGQFNVIWASSGTGTATLKYDGSTSASLSLNPGLGGIDFTYNQGTGFRISARSNVQTTVSVTVYSGNGVSGTASTIIAADSTVTSDYLIPFSSFPTTLSFTKVVAVELTVTGTANSDLFIDAFTTYGSVSNSIGQAIIAGSVLPCDLDYYRIQTLTNLSPGDYLKITFNQTGATGYTNFLGALYIVSSQYTDLESELASNVNIVDTLGELPGPNNYIYTCTASYCDIEITSCELTDSTYYLAVAGNDASLLYYTINVYLRVAPIYQLFAQTPQPVFLDQRPASPNDNTLYYRYYAIDIPESLYSEGTYLVVNISRAEPYPGLEISLNYGGLPENPLNTGVIGQVDYNSNGTQVDNCIFQYCVNTAVSASIPYYENPVNTQPRIPCVCTTQVQSLGTSGAFQLTCNLTVDPCQFQYGTWYVAVLLPTYSSNPSIVDTANYTITPYVVQPTITTLFRNVTFKGTVVPEAMTHYKLSVPASDVSLGQTHLIVQISNIRNGYVDLWVHQGLGGDNNLAGGPEGCVPANATCHTRDACNVVIEKCHFTPGTWYIGVSVGYSANAFEVFDYTRLPVTFTIRANWLSDPTPTVLLAGVPAVSTLGESLYDFYAVTIPQTIDTWLFIELYSRCQDTSLILSVLQGGYPGGECYERPDFYCLTGDPRDLTYTTGPPTNLKNKPVQRQSCTFMIQTCELQAGTLYLSVYGQHQGYTAYGDTTFYQIGAKYTLYVDFDTAAPLISGVSYSDNVVNYQYQHYYIRADHVKQGSYLSVEVTNIQHGVPQSVEVFVNYNYLAGNCPCYDHLYNCTGVPPFGYTGSVPAAPFDYTNIIPQPGCLDTCCTIIVPSSDFRPGVWYVSVLGVNQDSAQYTTPIGYTVTVTIHAAPTFIPLFLGQAVASTVPQWNETLELTHFKLAAVPVPLNDLVITITYPQNSEYLGKHDNFYDNLGLYVNLDNPADDIGYGYSCVAQILSESYCTVVIPHCEWNSNDVFIAVQGNFDSSFVGRFTIRASIEQIRDTRLTTGVSVNDRVSEGTYKHFYIVNDGQRTSNLKVDFYTNQDQDSVSVYLNVDTRAGTAPCFTNVDSCVGQTFCTFIVNARDLIEGSRYYVSVYGEAQWYDTPVEFTLLADFLPFSLSLQNGNPFTGHVLANEIQYYRYDVARQSVGDYLVIEIDNVQSGSLNLFLNYGSAAGQCPGYLFEQSCYADAAGTNWCEIRVPSCQLQLGEYYISVQGLKIESPCQANHNKIGYTLEINQITPLVATPEVDVGRDTTNTLINEYLPNTHYAHYQFRYTEDDYNKGYQVIVEITNVREGSLYVYYNQGIPSDIDPSCQLAQICTDGLSSGGSCYWQIPFSLTKPTFTNSNNTNLQFQYITVESVTGRYEVSYSILIWKEAPPSIVQNAFFTLDNATSSRSFPKNTELNITHFSQNEPYGWAQFIQLTNVPAQVDGELLEVFFYRIINNVGESTSFNVYLFPNSPAGPHLACSSDPSTLGSCEGFPTQYAVETTTQQIPGGPEYISSLCELPSGTGYDTTGKNAFYGYQCTVRVWPSVFSKYCNNVSTWWLTIVPSAPNAGAATIPLAGLSYSVQWRVRNIKLDENFQINSISLNSYINNYNYTASIPVKSLTTQDEGWLSLYIDVVPSSTKRISIQTNFVNGTSAVYIQGGSFADPTGEIYYCASNSPNALCSGSGRFIVSECNANLYQRYYITVRNLSGNQTISLVQFRIIIIEQPSTISIPAHLTSSTPFKYNSKIFSPFNVTGVEGENYDTYVIPVDDHDIYDHQTLIINVQRPTVDAGSLNLYVRYGAQAGEYVGFNHAYYPLPEGCYTWEYSCALPAAGSVCTLQIPHTELIRGYYYISIYNPDFLFSGVSNNLPDYSITVVTQNPPTYLTLGTPLLVTNSSIPVAFPGTYINYRVNVTADNLGLIRGGVDTGSSYSGDYYTSYLSIILEGLNGPVTLYVNYDDLAGKSTTQQFNPYGYYQESLSYIATANCVSGSNCYIDITPCNFGLQQLKSGVYYISLLDFTATAYNLTAYVFTDSYQDLSYITVAGTGDRIGTTNNLWSHTVSNTELQAKGDGFYNYRYTLNTATGGLDGQENYYYFVNITIPSNFTTNTASLSLTVWRDDCSEFVCSVPLGGGSWCAIDALTLAPCSIHGGRFYFKVQNPNNLPFTLYFYQNETVVQSLANGQVITEIIYPYEYQEYFFDAEDVLEGATLTVQVCADCGDVEAWIRPSYPAGPGPDATGYETSCSLDHCAASAANVFSETGASAQCCYLFLDTCQFSQQGYYIAIRGVSTTFPSSVNQHLYLPARYQIQAVQTNVQINGIAFATPALVSYTATPSQIPQQFAIDFETANIGALLRFTLILPDATVYLPATTEYATLTISQNSTVGYTSACSYPYSCQIVSTQSSLTCDFIISASDVTTGRYYIWADAPRGSQVIVERWDPYIPIIDTNLLYTATINGPLTNYIFDGPFRPQTQYYRFDLDFSSIKTIDAYAETFFLRVLISNVTHGAISASLNSGNYPYNAQPESESDPIFLDNLSCTIATDGYDCYIDLQLCNLFTILNNDPTYRADTDDLDYYNYNYNTFWITITGLQQLAPLHSIQYSLTVQTSWEFTFFPINHTICNSVEAGDYVFHRLRPHATEYPQQTILRISLSDIDVVNGQEVDFLLRDNSVATEDCYDLKYRSGAATSSTSAVGVGVINLDWVCGYENLYLSVYGVSSPSGSTIDYRMNVTSVPVKVKELFNNYVYHNDDDDTDAGGSAANGNYGYDFYIFKAAAQNYSTSFLRVAVDSEYPFTVYLNQGSFAYEQCHIATGSAQSGTVNVYDFCSYENTIYYVTVIAQGPYSIYTVVRDDAKSLTLGEVFRDSLQQGQYQIYTLEICEAYYTPGDRLVIDIADVQNAGVYGRIQVDRNPGVYQSTYGPGVCDITGTSAFAQFGPGLSGYDFILVDHSKLVPGTYHILIQAQSVSGIDSNPQPVSFRLFPYLIDNEITPTTVNPNTILLNQVVDFYTLSRNANPNEVIYPRTSFYQITPTAVGYSNGIAFAQVSVQNLTGGLVTLRVTSGHLATPPQAYINGDIKALTNNYILPGQIQSGVRPFTFQNIINNYFSPLNPECDGSADLCATAQFADLAQYNSDSSVTVWVPSCYFDLGYPLYASVEAVDQFYENIPITYNFAVQQYADYTLLPPNTGVQNSFTNNNWQYQYYRALQADVQSARWRVVVSNGEGVLVTVRNNRCPLQATWTREIWCDADYFGHTYICDIEIPTAAAHPGNNAFFISVYGKNATYTIAYWRGLENCEVFTHNGTPQGLNFCAGLVNYPTWSYQNVAALDLEASNFFLELYNQFRVQPCWSGVTTDCNATLQQFACYESFRACDANGFYVGTCRSSCDAVVFECVNWFESVGLEHYNCSSSRYVDDGASTCTGSGNWAQFDINAQVFFGGNPVDILYNPFLSGASSLQLSFTLVFIAIAALFM